MTCNHNFSTHSDICDDIRELKDKLDVLEKRIQDHYHTNVHDRNILHSRLKEQEKTIKVLSDHNEHHHKSYAGLELRLESLEHLDAYNERIKTMEHNLVILNNDMQIRAQPNRCPCCDGSKYQNKLVNDTIGQHYEKDKCITCDGSGVVWKRYD